MGSSPAIALLSENFLSASTAGENSIRLLDE